MKAGRIITAPFRLIIAIANFIRALIIITFFAILILLMAYVFSPKARSCMNAFIFERREQIVPRLTLFEKHTDNRRITIKHYLEIITPIRPFPKSLMPAGSLPED